jgi:IS30 family transposase
MHYKHLSIEERELIQRGLWEKKSIRDIAEDLGRSISSVHREIKRNLDSLGRRMYIPRVANLRALAKRKSRGRQDRLKNDLIRNYVVKELKKRTSPEQIAGRIGKEYPGQTISHEAIYQFIYHQIHRNGWGLLKPGCEDLRSYLRRRKKRRTHKGMRRCQKMSVVKGLSIDLRPKIVSNRIRIGDWESDTVASKDNKAGINTLVERKTGLVFITKLRDKTSEATVSAIESRIKHLPEKVRQTATFDNGPENQKWEELEKKIGLKCFFANAYHSWERGTNENTNGLIRDFFPKKTDFATISDEELRAVEDNLNNRPRKRLDWKTPSEVFSKELNRFNISINMPSVALAG